MRDGIPEGTPAFDSTSEQTVISALLLGKHSTIDAVQSIVGEGDAFYIKWHRLIYQAILHLREGGIVIDPANVAALIDFKQLSTDKDKGYFWLVEWTDMGNIWSMESVEWHAKKIRDVWELRRVDNKLKRLLREHMTSDADLDSVYAEIEEILASRGGATSDEVISVSQAKEIYKQYVADIQKRKINFGWPTIDKATRGLVPGDVCYIFARTNVGKSALAQSMQLNIWERQSIKSIFFSLEMPVTSVYERMASMVSGWEEEGIEGMFLAEDEDRLLGDMEKYEDGVFFVEKSRLTLKDISRITSSTENVGAIFIDYMGLVKSQGRSPYERLSDLATELKATAKELGIPIICICQLSRAGGDGTIPVTITMVRDSGQIEECADVILGMHRVEQADELKLVVLKARRGRRGASCVLGFSGDTPKIVEMSREEEVDDNGKTE